MRNYSRWLFWVAIAGGAIAWIGMAKATDLVIDETGALCEMKSNGERIAVRGGLLIPEVGWGMLARPDPERVTCRRNEQDPALGQWSGTVSVGSNGLYGFTQTVTRVGDRVITDLGVTPHRATPIQGFYYWMDLPIELFRGGWAEVRMATGGMIRVDFPQRLPEKHHFAFVTTSNLVFRNSRGTVVVTVEMDRALALTLQDERKWNGTDYNVLIPFGGRDSNKVGHLKLALQCAIEPDLRPARVEILGIESNRPFLGMGGNFCFGPRHPATTYNLDHLNVKWARIECNLRSWEPQNDNDDPAVPNEVFFQSNALVQAKIRDDLAMARDLVRRRIPMVISTWQIPDWLCAEKGANWEHRRKIPREHWPELAESVGTYLWHLRETAGAEPLAFSFNEADMGVMVLLTPEEHRDLIELLGQTFERMGLKTGLMLGDTGNARGLAFTTPAANDSEALKYVRCVTFHSWSGGSPDEFTGWKTLADRLGVPLLVTELGMDADWRRKPYQVPGYALREVRLIQELILQARPQSLLQWELTDDYGLVPQVEGKLTPSDRFYFLNSFYRYVPTNSIYLVTTSDHSKVLMTGFIRSDSPAQKPEFVLHLFNEGPARQVTLLDRAQVVQGRTVERWETQGQGICHRLDPVKIRNHEIRLELPEDSLTSLTQHAFVAEKRAEYGKTDPQTSPVKRGHRAAKERRSRAPTTN
jgi:hypothetical protein